MTKAAGAVPHTEKMGVSVVASVVSRDPTTQNGVVFLKLLQLPKWSVV